ncbi:MAG: hypothetical protein ACC628_15860 [Pirellulaceae bacterium]
MATKSARIREYLNETLGIAVSPVKWTASRRLPVFLRDGYTFYQTEVLAVPCLLMSDDGEETRSPATVRKHMEQVRPKWDGEIIYVRDHLAAYERKQLIAQKVPFLVPGNQLYLPMLGIDLREHFRSLHRAAPTLSPAAQAVVLHLLLQSDQEIHTPAELAERLGYTKMSMTRVFNEMEAEDLGDIEMEGRQRCLTLDVARQELWRKALPLMRSPVKQRKHIHAPSRDSRWLVAGLSALAKYSMLASPPVPVVATTTKQWKRLQKQFDFEPTAADDPDSTQVEIWSYDPELFARNKAIDRLSLFLSLRDSKDERVQAALEEMMEAVRW